MAYKLEGIYKLSNPDTITNTKTNLTLHLRKRRKPSRTKPDYFLSINQPTYTYISSLYQSPSKRQAEKLGNGLVSFDNLKITNPTEVTLYFDYQNQDYILEKQSDKAVIKLI